MSALHAVQHDDGAFASGDRFACLRIGLAPPPVRAFLTDIKAAMLALAHLAPISLEQTPYAMAPDGSVLSASPNETAGVDQYASHLDLPEPFADLGLLAQTARCLSQMAKRC